MLLPGWTQPAETYISRFKSDPYSILIAEMLLRKTTALQVERIFRFTSGKGDAKKLAREGIKQGFTHFVSVGGDGTAHEVVN